MPRLSLSAKPVVLIAVILISLFLFSTASAQEVVTADEVNRIAKGLFCPVCESEPLDTCATQACIDWREDIRIQLEEGATEQEVYAYFQNRYGDRVLAKPPVRGSSLVLWIGLPVLLVIAGFGFFRYMRQIESDQAITANTQPQSASEDDYIDQIERELADRQ